MSVAEPLTTGQLERAYRQMKTIREFEERLHVEIMTGEIAGFTHLYAGQEAVAVGVCEHLATATTSSPRTAATATASPRAATSSA